MLICILLLMFTTGEVHSAGRNPCSYNPLMLTASETPKHISSPYEEDHEYPPFTDCQFLLRTTNPDRRIAVTVIHSKLEEPLFGNCTDYVTARDGDQRLSGEIVTWCGHDVPSQIVGTTNSMFLAFHSDGIVESNGFNLSYVEFELPGCPPGWFTQTDDTTIDPNDRYCYWLGGLNGKGLSWPDAQYQCSLTQANLVTFDSPKRSEFVRGTFNGHVSDFWTAYNSLEEDTIFVSVDGTAIPADFPDFPNKQYTDDCILKRYNGSLQSYHPADCRSKHPFICARRHDGTTEPRRDKQGIRIGLSQASLDITYWILIVVVLILLILLCCIGYGHCKDRCNGSRVEPSEDNRLVTSQTALNQVAATGSGAASRTPSTHANLEPKRAAQATSDAKTKNKNKQTKDQKQDTAATLNNVTVPLQQQNNPQTPVETFSGSYTMQEMQPTTSSALHPEGIEEGRSALRDQAETRLDIPSTPYPHEYHHHSEHAPLETELSLASSKQASNLANPTALNKSMFVRPKMSLLEHSSAISLDDFWKNI